MASLPDSIPVDKVESLLCCSICLERLQDPRTLPCFHSYCKHCLESYVAKHREIADIKKIEEFECPSCRSTFCLKEHEEVANIRGSHFIQNMVDVLNAEREPIVWKCSNHSEKASCCRCVSCEAFLCEDCLKVHENWSTFKKHSVLTIEELKKPENHSKITGPMRCEEHTTKKLKFYCETCNVLICRYCMDFNHVRPEHLCHPIEKVVEKHREDIQCCCDTLNEKLTVGEKSLKDVEEDEEALKKTMEKAKDEISKQKSDIIKAVEDVFQSKIDKIDRLYVMNKGLLAGRRKKVESFIDKVKCAGNMSKNVLRKGSNEEIIESHKMVKDGVEMVKNESESVKDMQKLVSVDQNWFVASQVHSEVVSKLFDGVIHNVFLNSSILEKTEHIQQMLDWFESKDHTCQLCYRASTDGWNAEGFHAKCDNKGPTIVLVKVDDYVFGGFTDVGWEKGPDRVCSSKNAFIFSLSNKDNLQPFKASVMLAEQAYTFNAGLGPLFGKGGYSEGHDLFISKHPPTKKCYSDFGNVYKLPDGYVKGTEKARCLLAGSLDFTPSEIEVFYQKKN